MMLSRARDGHAGSGSLRRAAAALIPLAAALTLPAGPLRAQRSPDTVFVVNGSHLDIGFTAPPFEVRARHVGILDEAIRAALSDSGFVWFEEGGWTFDVWWRAHRHDSALLRDVRRLLADGQLGIGATWLSPHAAAFPEAIGFLTAHLDALRDSFDYRPTVAVVNDVPAIPEAFVDAVARRGVRYLLMGVNLSWSPPIPERFVRTPFWWETASGARVLAYVDPSGFTAGFSRWGLDPDCATFFAPRNFPRGEPPLETMRRGLTVMRDSVDPRYDVVLVQQALDNWDTQCARRLVGHAREWNATGAPPVIVNAQPEAYFRHIEARYGSQLPVYRGEWGARWDVGRANAPVWTWRIRQAARALDDSGPAEQRLALATTLDHNLQMGRPWDGFTESQYGAFAAQNAAIFESAVGQVLGIAGTRALPPPVALPPRWSPSPAWQEILAGDEHAIRLRFVSRGGFPSGGDGTEPAEISLSVGAHGRQVAARAQVDRTRLHDGVVVLEIPLRTPDAGVRLAPARSPDAVAGHWLLGEPPPFVIAPEGLLLLGFSRTVEVRSALVLAWSLRRDAEHPDVTWLSGLVVMQSTRCRLKDGTERELPFAVLYPGEPATLDAGVELELRH